MENTYCIKDVKTQPDPVYSYKSNLKSVPIIIDNGSYMCRVGFASDEKPRLNFRNCYARQRKDRNKKNPTNNGSLICVANDMLNIEAFRFQLRSQFDENVITQFESQEIIFDYIFSHLGIDTPTVDHPIVITEPLLNPVYSRERLSELLFECYGVPKVSFCVDGLLSFFRNTESSDGLLINIGNVATHVLPFLGGKIVAENARRLRVGGQHLVRYLWRCLQLKYPQLVNAITISRCENILYNFIQIAEDYESEISKWADSKFFGENVTKIQFPFVAQIAPSTMTPDQQKERKREAAKRLSDINAKKRDERLEEDKQELARLLELEEAMAEFTPDEAEYLHALEEAQVNSLKELKSKINSLRIRIEKIKLKISLATDVTLKEEDTEDSKSKRLASSLPQDPEERQSALDAMKEQWRDIQMRKNSRKIRRQEMAKRRTLASQERMRIISQLAKHEKKDDNFGLREEDWDVYKAINKEGGGSDSEEDDDKLQEVECILKQFCPEFMGVSPQDAKPTSLAENYQCLLSTEKIRVGEILFKPSICGSDQAGVAGILDYVLRLHSAQDQERLVNNVVVAGSPSKIPGLKRRLEKELLAMRPFQSSFSVKVVNAPELDPWLEARDKAGFIMDRGLTKENYLEYKLESLQDHKFGNNYWTPANTDTETPSKSNEPME